MPGRGVVAWVGDRELRPGGPRLGAARAGAMPEDALWLQARGETAMVRGEGDRPLAVFGLADQPRGHVGHSHGVSADADRGKLAVALALIVGFMVFEVVVGVAG